MNILLADDSKDIQDWIINYIKERCSITGIQQAFTVSDAMDELKSKKYDVVISDIRMPLGNGESARTELIEYGGNGFDLLSYIKNKQEDIPVIMITNYSYPQYKEKAQELGAEYFLNKSSDLKEIATIIKKIGEGKI